MSDSEVSIQGPGVGEKCSAQVSAAKIVARQLDRSKEVLKSKGLSPLFCFELYVFNCDRHGVPAHHIDLVNSGLESIGPDGLPHVIAVMESLVKDLKARTA